MCKLNFFEKNISKSSKSCWYWFRNEKQSWKKIYYKSLKTSGSKWSMSAARWSWWEVILWQSLAPTTVYQPATICLSIHIHTHVYVCNVNFDWTCRYGVNFLYSSVSVLQTRWKWSRCRRASCVRDHMTPSSLCPRSAANPHLISFIASQMEFPIFLPNWLTLLQTENSHDNYFPLKFVKALTGCQQLPYVSD